jgi:indolepyruvate ferredoxin oxidoreductase
MSFLPRAPNYCSGCPHNRSTVAVDGQLNGGGIGCHTMGILIEQPERELSYVTPMGAEGAVWIGAAAFVDPEHLTQNVGDGTFYHSASQSLRACVGAGVNITFRILYNGHVAMTGGQAVTGSRSLDALCRLLQAEGVRRIIVVSDDPARYPNKSLAGGIVVRDRDEYEASLRELQSSRGVTVLIFDQQCAAEQRRARKRGKLPEPEKHVVINEDVCEGCGDCGAVSNCMSVQPVETEFGRKTQIHQLSCNKDFSCLKGDCPSFLTVYSHGGPKHRPVEVIEANSIPEPLRPALRGTFRIYMPGIGGTGVVTTNQILAVAAMLEGHGVQVLDQTGLAQKGGAVLSSLRIFSDEAGPELSNKVGIGQADLVLALDLLGASSPTNLDRLSKNRTVVVGDSAVQPTADAIRDVRLALPPSRLLGSVVLGYSKKDQALLVPASKTAEDLLHDQSAANLFLVGVAYQAGRLPIRSVAIERAIEMNGAAVHRNLQAFRCGRLYVHDPARVRRAASPSGNRADDPVAKYSARLGGRDRAAYSKLLRRADRLPKTLQRLLAIRLGELILYQSPNYAQHYLEVIETIAAAESTRIPGNTALTEVAARNLHKLMAYKDEYETARLLLGSEWEERVRDGFQRPSVKYNLHVPILRALGLKHKLELGMWFRPMLVVLRKGKRLRGTGLDVFGRTRVRRVESELPGWYVNLLSELTAGLSPANHAEAVAIADLADRIRGFEAIKLGNVVSVQQEVATRLVRWRDGRPTAKEDGAASAV